MSRMLVILALLLMPFGGLAQELKKSNSLTIDKDFTTGGWVVTCEISVGGVDQNDIYSGRMFFYFAPQEGAVVYVFDAFFQVEQKDRTWNDYYPGFYDVSAKLKGQDVVVHAEVKFDSLSPSDVISCDSRIDLGPQPPVRGTLFETSMRSTMRKP